MVHQQKYELVIVDLVLLSIFVGVSGRFHGRFLSINKRKLDNCKRHFLVHEP